MRQWEIVARIDGVGAGWLISGSWYEIVLWLLLGFVVRALRRVFTAAACVRGRASRLKESETWRAAIARC